jgi:hypothetical protein
VISLQNNTGFRTERIEEPELLFANEGTARDPRAGLLRYGPYPRDELREESVVNVGIIGSYRSVSDMEALLRKMRTGFESTQKRERWKQPFPGLGLDSELKLNYYKSEKWIRRITDKQLSDIRQVPDRDDRIDFGLDIIKGLIGRVCRQTPTPDIVFVVLPEEIIEMCSDPSTDTEKIRTRDGGDFRSQLKIAGMRNEPIQLITPQALQGGDNVQERSEIAWNLAVAMLYKGREGRPWKSAELRSRTCYAGISFYQPRSEDADMRASVAQVFIDDGSHFVIEGGPVEPVDAAHPQTHLSYDDAKRIVEKILEGYGKRRDTKPERLVLHKKSPFKEDETRGFSDAASGITAKDFLWIQDDHPLKLLTPGDEPPLRGTLAIAPHEEEYYLFTTGFVPEQCVYNNSGLPSPLAIRPHDEYFTGYYRQVCREIMKFTKLDWNSSDFCRRLPVTISIAEDVSDILAEPKTSEIDLQSHYYYYM